MAWLADIKERFFRRQLAEEKAKMPTGKAKRLHPDTVSEITILFPADSAEDRKAVDKWRDAFQKPGRKIKALGYFANEVGAASFDFITVSVKDLNWYGVPKGEEIDKFRATTTELLIRIGPVKHPVLDYLAATKPAALKVGPYTNETENPYHLQFDGQQALKPKEQFAAIAKIFTYTNATAPSPV
ncbi:MAG: hypothetical protein AAF840_08890 [Bacteroidota bacterium]